MHSRVGGRIVGEKNGSDREHVRSVRATRLAVSKPHKMSGVPASRTLGFLPEDTFRRMEQSFACCCGEGTANDVERFRQEMTLPELNGLRRPEHAQGIDQNPARGGSSLLRTHGQSAKTR
jgi:hypothetical protein